MDVSTQHEPDPLPDLIAQAQRAIEHARYVQKRTEAILDHSEFLLRLFGK